MFTRAAAALLVTLLAGCVYYPSYQYVADPRGDYYYEAEPDGYRHGYASLGYGYGPGCGYYGRGWWPYYSPCYAWYPGYGFFYGVTWFPYWGWGGYDHWAWYHPYSPYRYSYYDHYYDYQGDWRRHHDRNGPRFGSAANEAERLANLSAPRASSAGAGGYAPYGGGAPRWSRERDEGGTRGGYPDLRGSAIDGGAGWGGGRNAGDWRARNPGYSGAPVRYQPAPGSGGRGQMPHRSSSPPSRGGGGFDRGGGANDGGSRSSTSSRPWSESHNHGRERDPD
jgi:hypothetical protein